MNQVWIAFIGGMLAGGIVGIMAMCMVFINTRAPRR